MPGLGIGLGTFRAPSRASFSPLSLSPALWLDGSDSATLFQLSNGTTPATANDDPVGYWGDKSGNARHVTQATAGFRPLLKTAAQNSKNVIQTDGVDDFLATVSITVAQPFTLFAVVKATSGSRYFASADTAVRAGIATTPRLDNFAGVTLSFDTVINQFMVVTSLYNGASSVIRKNGAEVVAGNVGTQTIGGGIHIGQSAGQPYAGQIAEILFFSSNMSASYSLVEAYLKSKWGTP